jgi:hypothetical protein
VEEKNNNLIQSFCLDAALAYAALHKSGREIYLVYAVINNYANIFYSMGGFFRTTQVRIFIFFVVQSTIFFSRMQH